MHILRQGLLRSCNVSGDPNILGSTVAWEDNTCAAMLPQRGQFVPETLGMWALRGGDVHSWVLALSRRSWTAREMHFCATGSKTDDSLRAGKLSLALVEGEGNSQHRGRAAEMWGGGPKARGAVQRSAGVSGVEQSWIRAGLLCINTPYPWYRRGITWKEVLPDTVGRGMGRSGQEAPQALLTHIGWDSVPFSWAGEFSCLFKLFLLSFALAFLVLLNLHYSRLLF